MAVSDAPSWASFRRCYGSKGRGGGKKESHVFAKLEKQLGHLQVHEATDSCKEAEIGVGQPSRRQRLMGDRWTMQAKPS
eukprot:768394-Hanusia_phi.AAC.3